MNISNICVIGNDGRMDYAAQVFYDMGYEIGRDVKHINEHSVILLPPPAGEQITKTLLPYLHTGQLLYGGVLSNRLIHECEILDIPAIDYLKWDHVTEENAKLTAKGILKEASCMHVVLQESSCLVTGFGFCGKALAKALDDAGANVDVMVRRKDLMGSIEEQGYGFVDLNATKNYNFQKYSYIFNTVPALILDSQILSKCSDNTMIFDIASKEGGTDFKYCSENGIFAIQSLGIPGREYPKEAGEVIAKAVIDDINLK